MQNSTALFCVDVSTPDQTIQTAIQDAAKHGTHIAVLLHGEFPTLPIGAYSALPYGGISVPDAWSETLKSAQTGLKDRVNAIERLLAAENVSGDVIPLFAAEADIRQGVAQVARTCDIVFFSSDLRLQETVYKELLHGVLFESPVPAMINGTLDMAHDTVLLAWNDSLASARAAHLALPYLQNAEHVHIVGFDAPSTAIGGKIEPGREAAAWLSHHSCDVTLTQLPTGGREVGSCILDHANEIGADLVVAGAYGHSRLRQAVFGGTSRTLIEQETVPIFMAH
ncbi:universal stress protein [Pseudaestuariivita atlantica]|uniref:universal stress protein n=1 Tax=Pseudaestuariivita atlantica TaxID=1317121 RepID=UPI0009E3EF74|nr:universal stress protein [Pseudaestuariivita atlantica]